MPTPRAPSPQTPPNDEADPEAGRPSDEEREEEEEPPEALLCPLTHELMIDPVIVVGSGQTYERGPIERWLASHDTDPLTGAQLTDKSLRENVLVRSMCRDYGEVRSSQELQLEEASQQQPATTGQSNEPAAVVGQISLDDTESDEGSM